ncbi:MAG: hypothetical protein Q9174_004134 [Haloplaca sp. 1 TL-2023]
MSSSIRPATIALATVGTLATGLLGYAVYFDHRRRTDPEFRKALKRESRKTEKLVKEEAEAEGIQQKQTIRKLVTKAQNEGFPDNTEDKEVYFMQEVGHGEATCQNGAVRPLLLEINADKEQNL